MKLILGRMNTEDAPTLEALKQEAEDEIHVLITTLEKERAERERLEKEVQDLLLENDHLRTTRRNVQDEAAELQEALSGAERIHTDGRKRIRGQR